MIKTWLTGLSQEVVFSGMAFFTPKYANNQVIVWLVLFESATQNTSENSCFHSFSCLLPTAMLLHIFESQTFDLLGSWSTGTSQTPFFSFRKKNKSSPPLLGFNSIPNRFCTDTPILLKSLPQIHNSWRARRFNSKASLHYPIPWLLMADIYYFTFAWSADLWNTVIQIDTRKRMECLP